MKNYFIYLDRISPCTHRLLPCPSLWRKQLLCSHLSGTGKWLDPLWAFSSLGWMVHFFSNFCHMSTSSATLVALLHTLFNFSTSLELRVDQNWTFYFMCGLNNHTSSSAGYNIIDACKHTHSLPSLLQAPTAESCSACSPPALQFSSRRSASQTLIPPAGTATWDYSNLGAGLCISLC